MFCPKCGKEYSEESAKFCSSCGHNFGGPVSNTSTQTPSMQNTNLEIEVQKKSLAIAGLLNLLIPGAGYFYVAKPVWGIILVVATTVALFYSPASVTALYLLSIVGSIYYADKYNKKLLEEAL